MDKIEVDRKARLALIFDAFRKEQYGKQQNKPGYTTGVFAESRSKSEGEIVKVISGK